MTALVNAKVLIIEGHPLVGQLLKEVLEKNGCSTVDLCQTVEQGWQQFLCRNYGTVILSSNLNSSNGTDFLTRFHERKNRVPVVMLVDGGEVERAVSLVQRQGAFDVLERPVHPEKLLRSVEHALACGQWRTEVIKMNGEREAADQFMGLMGRSAAMKKIFNLIERIKQSSVNILIVGPSGSGKEMIAQAIHQTSPRAQKKFVAINCSAIPETLLEGELFGYKKGAFTDAHNDKMGLFQEAEEGTIFLDEIGDMPLGVQPKILRALQEREIRPLGGIHSIKVNVRIIAATNQDLREKMSQKLFREDLYYRLNAMQIDLPALKDHAEDIPLLVGHFLERMRQTTGHAVKGISQEAMRVFMNYTWPGNVREMENVLERATLLTRHEFIMPEDLLFSGKETAGVPLTDWARQRLPLEEVEKEYILQMLNALGGNRSETAQILGIGRKTLYNKLAKYGKIVSE